MRFITRLGCMLAIGVGSATSYGSLEQGDVQTLTTPGVVQLRCKNPESQLAHLSLGTLISNNRGSAPDTGVDIVLVAAHGLRGSLEHCIVSRATEQFNITQVTKGSARNAQADWAVVTLSGQFSEEVQRFPWYRLDQGDLESFIRQQGRVFMIKHLSGHTGAPCELRIPRRGLRDPSDRTAIVVSDCSTIPGMSGAPVILKVDEQATLVGLTVGHRYDLAAEPKEWLSRANVVRLIDLKIEAAIVEAQQSNSR